MIEYPFFDLEGLEDVSVLTTSDIPSQARACNFPTLHFLLPVVCQRLTGRHLPRELVDLILASGNFGITREEAEGRRRGVMEERGLGAESVSAVSDEDPSPGSFVLF